jgi:hypothetical protein
MVWGSGTSTSVSSLQLYLTDLYLTVTTVHYHGVAEIAQNYLTHFELACTTHDPDIFLDLFTSDGIWRDIIPFTNDLRSIAATGIRQAAAVSTSLVLMFALLTIEVSKRTV